MTISHESAPSKSLLVSILCLGKPQNVLTLMTDLPRWLAAFAQDSGTEIHIVVRNNAPRVDFDGVGERLAQCEAEYPLLRCTLVTGQANLGFGRGHNENYRLGPADYLLILNDDIGFPNLDWLPQAVSLLAADARTACVGALENPQYLNPMFGNGRVCPALAVETLKYAEASVLLFSGPIFERIGMFDERLQWAMCEDADLSLRAQQHDYRLRWISMPHEHWRSMSVNSLPSPVRSSILEHNRASLSASWGRTFATGRIGHLEVYDIWSDGMGDVFCALPHLLVWLNSLTPTRRAAVVVNTSHPELVEMLGIDGIRITSVRDQNGLLEMLAAEGVTALHTTRDVNYALPVNIHPLLCGALGVPVCDADGFRRFRATLPHSARSGPGDTLPKTYCVVHLEFAREHDGRGLAPASAKAMLGACAELFDTIVLIGKERRLAAGLCDQARAQVIDLQGRLSLQELMAIIAGATFFVGLDSFPAHVAQAAGVRTAVFFGAVHPLARVWNTDLAWPLVAELDCIGCYHTHLEPSAPFCMRRDEACATGPDSSSLRQTLQAMVDGTPYPWAAQHRRMQSQQARWLGFMRHHPAPPERMLRPYVSSNERVSNLVYQILDHTAELLSSRYRTTSIAELTEQVRSLEADLFARQVELDELRQLHVQPQLGQLRPSVAARQPVRIVQLSDLALQMDRCTTAISGQWLDVLAVGDDPHLSLPALCGRGGRVQFRLICTADHADTLQVFWSRDRPQFSEESQRAVALGGGAGTIDLSFDLSDDELLWLRIDPLLGRGKVRLRGSISGAFELLETGVEESEVQAGATEWAPPTAPPAQTRRRQPRKRASA